MSDNRDDAFERVEAPDARSSDARSTDARDETRGMMMQQARVVEGTHRALVGDEKRPGRVDFVMQHAGLNK